MPKANDISDVRWNAAIERYELGYQHASQIADELGVSPQTVMREMRKRGAVKGRRASETVQELEGRLARDAEARVLREAQRDALASQHVEASLAVLDRMMEALQEAYRVGDLALAEGVVAETTALFAPSKRRSAKNSW